MHHLKFCERLKKDSEIAETAHIGVAAILNNSFFYFFIFIKGYGRSDDSGEDTE